MDTKEEIKKDYHKKYNKIYYESNKDYHKKMYKKNKNKHRCEICNYSNTLSNYNQHIKTKKHLKNSKI